MKRLFLMGIIVFRAFESRFHSCPLKHNCGWPTTLDGQNKAKVNMRGVWRWNAPTFIHAILHKESYETATFISGRSDEHPTKLFGGVQIDLQIPDMTLQKIAEMNEVIPLASCQGTNMDCPTYFIFGVLGFEKNKQRNECVAKMLNDGFYVSESDEGTNGAYRLGITSHLWPEKDKEGFSMWWENLPQKIHVALRECGI